MAQLDTDIIKLLANNGIDYKDNVKLAVGLKDLVIKYSAADKSVQVLKSELFTPSNLKEGTKCRVCNQNVKMYKKSIDSEMAKYLIEIYKQDKKTPNKIWFHVEGDLGVTLKVGGSWAKLRFWELIEEKPKDPENKAKRTSGLWRITDKGKRFVLLQDSVKKYVKLYNQTFYGFEGEDSDIREALGEKFNYSNLMSR